MTAIAALIFFLLFCLIFILWHAYKAPVATEDDERGFRTEDDEPRQKTTHWMRSQHAREEDNRP